MPLGAFAARLFAYLREAENPRQALEDQRRLGQVLRYLDQPFWEMGDHEQAIASGQRALELAEHTQTMTHCRVWRSAT